MFELYVYDVTKCNEQKNGKLILKFHSFKKFMGFNSVQASDAIRILWASPLVFNIILLRVNV